MKDLKGYEGIYAATEDGQIWAYPKSWNTGINGSKGFTRKGMWLKQTPDKKGYLRVRLCKNYVKAGGLAHRLIAEAFVPNPQNLPQVNHINGIKTDNRISNLEWCTNTYNMRHAFKTGLFKDREAKRVKDTKGRYTSLKIATTKPPF